MSPVLLLLTPVASRAAITDDLIVHWKFDSKTVALPNATVADDSGSTTVHTANLVSGNVQEWNGADSNVPDEIVAGQISNALNFDNYTLINNCCGNIRGQTQYSTANGADFDFNSQAFTVSFWLNSSSNSGNQLILSNGQNNDAVETWGIGIGSPGSVSGAANKVNFWTKNGGTSVLSTTTDVPVGTWTHYVATFDGIDTLQLFVDGSLDATDAAALNPTNGGGGRIHGGGDPNNTDIRYDDSTNGNARFGIFGLVDDFGIWRRALSDDEIAAVFAAGELGQDLSTAQVGGGGAAGTPEPSTFALALFGLSCIGMLRRRKRSLNGK